IIAQRMIEKTAWFVRSVPFLFLLMLLPQTALAQTDDAGPRLDLTAHWAGMTSIVLFVLAYCLVIAEEFTTLRKSKPVILAAAVIWGLLGFTYAQNGIEHAAEEAVREFLVEFGELFLFL